MLVVPSLVVQALDNLIVNAAEATDGQGRIQVHLRKPSARVAVIEVHDDGPGVPDDLRHRVFETLYTTKSHGTGLGMVAVRGCASAHHGTVDIDRSHLGGALFRLTLQPMEPRAAGQERGQGEREREEREEPEEVRRAG